MRQPPLLRQAGLGGVWSAEELSHELSRLRVSVIYRYVASEPQSRYGFKWIGWDNTNDSIHVHEQAKREKFCIEECNLDLMKDVQPLWVSRQ